MTTPIPRPRGKVRQVVAPQFLPPEPEPSTATITVPLDQMQTRSSRLAWDFLFPSAFYTICFFILTYPSIWLWRTHFYCDGGDGLQNVWNLWWIHKAIIELHQSPWYTTWLHSPTGTTLIGHTLNPINGFIGIPLGWIFPLVQVHNIIVTGTFTLSGLTAFWLAKDVTGKYWPAIAGGYAFTFTGMHFAHAEGHMQMISMEFIPLFLFCWLRLLRRPTLGWEIASAVSIFAVQLCDFYFFFYCVIAGAIAFVFYAANFWRLWRAGQRALAQLLIPFAVFIAVSGALCAPLTFNLLYANNRDPLNGAHPPEMFSADPFALVIPGGHSLLGKFTKEYWSALPGNAVEQSIEVGFAVILMAIWGVIARGKSQSSVWYWVTLAVIFYVLSLGPSLFVHGERFNTGIMPYAGFETLIPPLRLSGCPVRMTVIVALSLSILSARGLAAVMTYRRGIAITITSIFCVVMIAELWPIRPSTYAAKPPPWTIALRDLPDKGAVINLIDQGGRELYWASLFNRPIPFGYISREPQSVVKNDSVITDLFHVGDLVQLRQKYGITYIVFSAPSHIVGLHVVYSDADAVIQELPAQQSYDDFHL